MKFEILKGELVQALARCVAVVQKSTMPILSTVRIEAMDHADCSYIDLSATDTQISVKCDVDAAVIEDGGICVDAAALLKRIKMMPDGAIKLEAADYKLVISAAGSNLRYTLLGVHTDEFPKMPWDSEQTEGGALKIVHVPLDVMGTLLSRARSAASSDWSRVALCAINLECVDGELLAVATDGHRLHVAQEQVESQNFEVLVPFKGAELLGKLCRESDEDNIQLTCGNQRVGFHVPGVEYHIALTSTSFVPWRQVVPELGSYVTVDREAFVQSVKSVSVSTDEALKILVGGDSMRIEGESPGDGECADSFAVENISGVTFKSALSPRYLLDALEATSHDSVEVYCDGPMAPFVIKGSGDESFTAVVMPVSV